MSGCRRLDLTKTGRQRFGRDWLCRQSRTMPSRSDPFMVRGVINHRGSLLSSSSVCRFCERGSSVTVTASLASAHLGRIGAVAEVHIAGRQIAMATGAFRLGANPPDVDHDNRSLVRRRGKHKCAARDRSFAIWKEADKAARGTGLNSRAIAKHRVSPAAGRRVAAPLIDHSQMASTGWSFRPYRRPE